MTKIWLKTTQGSQIYTDGRCDFNLKIRRRLSCYRFSLQLAEVHKSLKVEDMNLTAKSRGVLKETIKRYNQQKWTSFLQFWDLTLPMQSGGVLKDKFPFQ